MNNIRKIIERRLEKIEHEYEIISGGKLKNNLSGQIEAYQDCLNLIDEYMSKIVTKQLGVKEMEALLQYLSKPHQVIIDKPKRTETEILKDFETLGYKVYKNDEYNLILEADNFWKIDIWKSEKAYRILHFTGMQEHKLLNELFSVWRWI